MTSRSDTSERAFSRPFSVDDLDPSITYPAHAGMTLRDYFAAKVIEGSIARDGMPRGDTKQFLADQAYEMANAMLKARDGSR